VFIQPDTGESEIWIAPLDGVPTVYVTDDEFVLIQQPDRWQPPEVKDV
jgi:hypothetical protein